MFGRRFESAHLHGKTDNQSIIGISTILNALFGVVFILLYQSVLNWCVIPVLFHRNSSPFEGKGESPNGGNPRHFTFLPTISSILPTISSILPTSACDPHSTPLLAFPWHKTQLLNRQSRPFSSDNLAILTEISSSHLTSLLNQQSRPFSSDNLAHSHRNLIFPSDISP